MFLFLQREEKKKALILIQTRQTDTKSIFQMVFEGSRRSTAREWLETNVNLLQNDKSLQNNPGFQHNKKMCHCNVSMKFLKFYQNEPDFRIVFKIVGLQNFD